MTETSRLIIGSTGSGKSEGQLVDLLRIAEEREYAVVLLDGHGPLALKAAGHWEARGFEGRMVYEPLDATDHVLCWSLLPRAASTDRSQRLIEESETRDDIVQCFLAQRNLATLTDKPWTKEWLEAAIRLCQAQPKEEPVTSLLSAFRVGSPEYERLLAGAGDVDADIVAKFRGMERLKRRSEVTYETQTGPARRLLDLVCDSEVVRLRSRPGTFRWMRALEEKRLIAFDGGGIRSTELKRTVFLLVSLEVIHCVRQHFAATQQPLPVVLVLEEAGALGLVTPFIVTALRELRKAGLATHIITQSSLDFGDHGIFESLLANTPWQAWYLLLSPADQELGGKALANPTFDPLAVHFTRTRALPDGVETVRTVNWGEAIDPRTHRTIRWDRRTGTAFRRRYLEVEEKYYKTPQLHEQEFRTTLATLRVGERIVRDLSGVRRERLMPLPPSRPLHLADAYTRAAIERVRRQPIYLSSLPPAPRPTASPAPDAAALLKARAGQYP